MSGIPSKEEYENTLKEIEKWDSQSEEENQSEETEEDAAEETEDESEGSEEPEESDNSDEQPEEKKSEGDFSEGFKKKYANKTADELLQIIHSQEKYIGKQSTDIGMLKKATKQEPSIRQIAEDLDKKIDTLYNEIDTIDPYADPEVWKKKQKEYNDLNRQRAGIEVKLVMAEDMAKRQNQQIFETTKDYYEKNFKLKFDDAGWSEIYNHSIRYSEDGAISKEDIDATVMKAIGREKFIASMLGQGAVNARQEIKQAKGLVTPQLGTKNVAAATTNIFEGKVTPEKVHNVLKGYDITNIKDYERFQKEVLSKSAFAKPKK